MYKFFNAHPKQKRVRDCVKRALTVATKQDYMDVQKELNRIKREQGAKDYTMPSVFEQYISELGGEKISFPAVKGTPRMNGDRFCEKYPQGTYILRMAHHITACINGVIYDTWNCSQKCVYMAWRLK